MKDGVNIETLIRREFLSEGWGEHIETLIRREFLSEGWGEHIL